MINAQSWSSDIAHNVSLVQRQSCNSCPLCSVAELAFAAPQSYAAECAHLVLSIVEQLGSGGRVRVPDDARVQLCKEAGGHGWPRFFVRARMPMSIPLELLAHEEARIDLAEVQDARRSQTRRLRRYYRHIQSLRRVWLVDERRSLTQSLSRRSCTVALF